MPHARLRKGLRWTQEQINFLVRKYPQFKWKSRNNRVQKMIDNARLRQSLATMYG